MVAAWQSFAHRSESLGGDPTVTKPTGTVDGDLLVAIGILNGAGTITKPDASWNTHANSQGAAAPLFWKIASGEPASYTFAVSSTFTSQILIVRINGHNPTTPIDVASGLVVASGTAAIAIPSVTPTGASRLLMQLCVKLQNTTFTGPGSQTERFDATSSTQNAVSAGGDEVVGAGATGTRTWTAATGGGFSVGYMLAINPASQTLSVSGFDTAVDFGAPSLKQNVTVSGFDTPVSFGAPSLSQSVQPAGFDIAVQFGTPAVGLTVNPAGFDVPVEFGAPSLGQNVAPDGFDLPVEFGTPTVILDNVLTVDGFDVPVQFGTPSLGLQPVVSGTVFNHETGDPVGAGVVVKLFDDNDLLIDTTVTDGSGSFIFYRPFGDTDLYWTLANYDVLGVPYHGVSDRGCAAT